MPKKSALDVAPPSLEALEQLKSTLRSLRRDAKTRLASPRRGPTSTLLDRAQFLDGVLAQVQMVGSDLGIRAQRLSSDAEAQMESWLTSAERQGAGRVRALLRRLNLPSHREVRALQRRIEELERKLEAVGAVAPAEPQGRTRLRRRRPAKNDSTG